MTRLRRKRRSTGVLDSARVEYVLLGHAAWEPHRAAFFTLEHFSGRWRLRSRRTANDRRALFILRAAYDDRLRNVAPSKASFLLRRRGTLSLFARSSLRSPSVSRRLRTPSWSTAYEPWCRAAVADR